MDARTRDKRRDEISHCRRRPVKPQRIYFPAEGIGEIVEVQPAKPLELCIEATDTEGNVVPWLTDEWWIRTHAFCKDRTVTVVILPTPRSLLDTVVLYQLEMVRRIAPKWRILGYARAMDAEQAPIEAEGIWTGEGGGWKAKVTVRGGDAEVEVRCGTIRYAADDLPLDPRGLISGTLNVVNRAGRWGSIYISGYWRVLGLPRFTSSALSQNCMASNLYLELED